MSEDYIFRYKLELSNNKRPFYADRLIELFRTQLQNIMNVILPTQRGNEVKVDGFKWLRGRGTSFQIFPKDDNGLCTSPIDEDDEVNPVRNSSGALDPAGIILKCNPSVEQRGIISNGVKGIEGEQSHSGHSVKSAALYEPRIEFIKRQLEALLSIVDLEKDGQTVQIDGFRLKNLSDWLSPFNSDPSEFLGYIGTRCDCDCIFCCNKGNPASLSLINPIRSAKEEFEEVKTRIKYFSPNGGTALFPSLGNFYETLMNPYCLETLRLLRQKSEKPLRITTNGKNLTQNLITQLSYLKPIYLYISLNSCSSSRRRKLMKDTRPEIAINALPLLKEEGIPYSVVIVPWPVSNIDEMLEDLSSTVAYANNYEAHLVEINLPGCTKYLSPQQPFDFDEIWRRTVSRVRALREESVSPIVVMPSMFEENLYEAQKNMPRVIGLVKNSPAFGSLKRGDMILKICGLPVQSRPQARYILSILQASELGEAHLTVLRDSQVVNIPMDLRKFSYPYSREIDNHLGIIFLGTGLRPSYIEKLREIVSSYRAKDILFLTSALVRPTFEQCLAESYLLGDHEFTIHIETPSNKFFGGNIFMGDLLVVQDFIDHIKGYLQRAEQKPDLIVLPSSPFNLGQWGRDLTGRVYLDIEREVDVPVELLECTTIYD